MDPSTRALRVPDVLSEDTTPLMVMRAIPHEDRQRRHRYLAASLLIGAALGGVGLLKGSRKVTSNWARAEYADDAGLFELPPRHDDESVVTTDVCADGTEFTFNMDLELADPNSEGIVLSSAGSEMSIALEQGSLVYSLDILNWDIMNVSIPLGPDEKFNAEFKKDREQMCITLTSKTMGSSSRCAEPPTWVPLTTFQVKSFARLTAGPPRKQGHVAIKPGARHGPPLKITAFQQTNGAVPITVALDNLPMDRLWRMDQDWSKIDHHIKTYLATLAGVEAFDVRVSPSGPTKDGSGSVFQTSIMVKQGSPCRVQKKLLNSIFPPTGGGPTPMASAVAAEFKEADIFKTGEVQLYDVVIPSREMSCDKFHCRKSFPRSGICLGGDCGALCCVGTLSEAMPFMEGAKMDEDVPPRRLDELEKNVGRELSPPSHKHPAKKPPAGTHPSQVVPPRILGKSEGREEKEEELGRNLFRLPAPKKPPAKPQAQEPPAAAGGVAPPADPAAHPAPKDTEVLDVLTYSFTLQRVPTPTSLDRFKLLMKNATLQVLQPLSIAAEDVVVSLVPSVVIAPVSTSIPSYSGRKPSQMEKRTIEQQTAKLAALESGKGWDGGFDPKQVAKAEKMAMDGIPEEDLADFRKLEAQDKQERKKEKEEEERLLGSRADFTIQVLVKNCDPDCQSQGAALLTQTAVKGAMPSTVNAGLLSNLHVPGASVKCFQYQCISDWLPRINDDELCFGEACEDTCCEAVKCSDFQCTGIYPIEGNADKTCTTEEQCQETCCKIPCAEYQCQPGTCKRECKIDESFSPVYVQDECCYDAGCCAGPIAWCLSCMHCMTPDEWCAAQEVTSGWDSIAKPHHPFQHNDRALEESQGDDDDQDVEEALKSPTRDFHVGHRLPAMKLRSPSSWDSLINESTSLRGSVAAATAKARLLGLREIEADGLKVGSFDLVSKAKKFLQANEGEEEKTWSWKQASKQYTLAMLAIKKHKHHKCNVPRGCESITVSSCSYYFESLFCLHRGFHRKPHSANAVQVLSDTVHAVSCGDCGTCWVWRICDAKPRQLFVPRTSYGPIKTVSVLFDTLRIVSGGAVGWMSGAAQVWEWRTGKQVANTHCLAGHFMSSAEIPELGTVLLGCSNGYVDKWHWSDGFVRRVPLLGRMGWEWAELLHNIQHYCKDAEGHAQWGMSSLFNHAKFATEQAFIDVVAKTYPGIKTDTCLVAIGHFFLTSFFGAVRSVAYVPTKVRFVTGTSDGKVRYWNAATGLLLKVMCGHEGPVNAVVGSLVAQDAYSGGDDGTIRVWCLDKGIQKLLFVQDYGGPVLSLAVYPANRILVAGSADGYIRMWDLHSGMLLCAINTGGGAVKSVAINPSNPLGQILAAGSDGYVRVFNPR